MMFGLGSSSVNEIMRKCVNDVRRLAHKFLITFPVWLLLPVLGDRG